jgi:hypothetical protein
MTNQSMNRMTLAAAGAAAMLSLAPVGSYAGPAAAFEFHSTAAAPHAPIRVVDSESMPISSPRSGSGWGTKTLFQAPNDSGALRILYVPPGAEGALVHYHEFHEWAYNIQGDFTNNESTTPDQVSGPLQRFREGNFLSRPPYSLHGGERGRQKWMASQIGAVILIMEEANVRDGTFTVDPAVRDKPETAGNMRFDPNYRNVLHWSTPRIIDTLEKMPWQPVEGSPGLHVKHLLDDPSHGFRAVMWFLEAGAARPDRFRPHYYEQAHQFNFVIAGDLGVQAMSRPGSPAESYRLTRHFLLEQAPMSIFGLKEGAPSQGGAVWLEVTYAKGTTWSKEPAPIENPTYAE